MSDQQDRSRSRGVSNEQSGERIARALAYKGPSREKSIDDVKSKIATPMRSSMLTPRSLAFQEPLSEPGPSYNQKRKASVDANTTVPSRKSSLKQTSTNFSQPRTFNSSPLVPRAAEPHRHDAPNGETNHGVEGTDSTASTAAPSTVWDELDELKSRIHRLELTGKLPPTSGAAISRASDERPPTAHTNATTLSASPKRGPGGIVQSIEVPSSQKESHPLLHSALAKSKEFLSSAVFEALETAANDALALSSMMGTAGQPGPISSGASSIGGVGGSTTVTDRQLRRKADSICRSLTELCLALSEGVVQNKPQQSPTSPRLDPLVTSPTITKFSGIANSRRPSAVPERIVTLNSSPRTTSRPEDRRNSVMASNALPSPRFNAHPISPTETPTNGRKTSLLLSRARRAGTEEPEDARSKSTMLLRTRRAQTEEPEDRAERKRPLITRGRRGTVDDRDDEARFRIPSRAIAEVQGVRAGNREYGSHLPPPPMPTTTTKESDPLGASALPRRRLTTATLNTRLTQPSTASTITTPTRRYFDRPVLTRETPTIASKPIDDRPQRQFSMGQTASLHRRATRESMIAAPSTATGNYR
ncbi:hypothetical protein F5X96DRAFT_264170 [Biscogniauxia mediterranea]|nr:hypothetical protein F5X96DRAFT_264170 [Biscogniauxia mediterranea]